MLDCKLGKIVLLQMRAVFVERRGAIVGVRNPIDEQGGAESAEKAQPVEPPTNVSEVGERMGSGLPDGSLSWELIGGNRRPDVVSK
ncbi:hypothetical protein R69608_06918 [Paraburkholderia nemoris]|nr:hypothetical protein R69608_06918 [Paraburkholderia nemoris]